MAGRGRGRGVSGILAALLLVLIVTSSMATVMVLTGRSMEHSRATLEESARRARDTAAPPALSLEATGGSLVATVISQNPTEVKWFIVERADGSVEVKPGGRVQGVARFTLSTGYNCQPVRVYMTLASGAAVAYDPRNDPLIARMPEGWNGWWTCNLPNGDQSSNRWWMIDPSRVQPVKASGGGGNDMVEYNIPPVRANFVGNTVEVSRVHREAVPQLGDRVTVRLEGAIAPLNYGESLLVLRVEGPSENVFFTGTVTAYIYVRGDAAPPCSWTVGYAFPRTYYRINVYHVVYTPGGNATVLYSRTSLWEANNRCQFLYEGRYRFDLVDSKAATMLYVYRTSRDYDSPDIRVFDARYVVNVTITKARVVNMKPTVFSLGSPGWVRLSLAGYDVREPYGVYYYTGYWPPLYPWVVAVWPGWAAPSVTVILDAGGGLSKNFTLTPGQTITLAYPGEVKIVVMPKPDPPFNPPSMRASDPPIFAPWRAPAIITAEYADGRREIIVISPTGHVTVSQGNLVFAGYGQLLGGLPFNYAPQNSRLAAYDVHGGNIVGARVIYGSWLSQPVLQVTNAYRVIAVIPDDRFKTGYVIAWVN